MTQHEVHRSESRATNDSVSATRPSAGGDNFDRRSLYAGYNEATSSSRFDAGTASGIDRNPQVADLSTAIPSGNTTDMAARFRANDASLPQSISFNNSWDASNLAASSMGDRGMPPATNSQDGAGKNTQERVANQYLNDAAKYAYGEPVSPTEEGKDKDALKTLATEAFSKYGEKGLDQLSALMNQKAIQQYGENAFDKAPGQFKDDLAPYETRTNPDGSTSVHMDFAQPYSSGKKSIDVNIPAKKDRGYIGPHVITGNYQI